MAFQFFGSGNRNGGRRLQDDSIAAQFFSPAHLPTATIFNASQSSLASTQPIAANQANVVNQNDIPSVGNVFGQLRLTEFKTTILSQNRVQVHTVIEYEPSPPQQALPLNGEAHYNGSGLSRTQLLSALSTRERTSTLPNNGFCSLIQGQDAARNMCQGQALNPFHGTELPNEAFSLYKNPSRNQPPIFQNYPEEFEYKGNGVIACPPISVRFPDPESDDEVTSHPSTDPNLRNSKNGPRLKNNQVRAHIATFHPGVTDPAPQVAQQNIHRRNYRKRRGDYKRGGPYQCTQCSSVFDKCQSFASHMGRHYKDENKEERKKRQELKYKNKDKLLLVQTSDGLTMVPQTFQMTDDMQERLRTYGGEEKPIGETIGKEVVKEEESVFMDVEENSPPIVLVKDEPN